MKSNAKKSIAFGGRKLCFYDVKAMVLRCKSYAFVRLFHQLDVVSLVGVIVAILVLAKVFEQILLWLLAGDADKHLSVGDLPIPQIALEGVVGR